MYFDIIRQKTATLIASCCAVGAASAGASEEEILQYKKFGSLTGIAFQIKDDLFDYGSDEVGKPLGIDIKEKKMTLPLIYALNNSDWWQRRKVIQIVKNESDKPGKVKEVIDFVKEKGGLEYASGVMQKFAAEAIGMLEQFPPSTARTHLRHLVEFTINRKI